MRAGYRTRLLGTVALLVVAGSLSACGSIRSALGSDKEPPDEFAVVTKAPLVMPPDFNLRPPAPGAPPANQVSPTQAAQAALFTADPATVASAIPGDMSMSEKLLIAHAGAATADNSIRQVIAADNKNLQATDDSFTDNLMFWQKSGGAQDPNVNADAEARRIATQPQTPAPATTDQGIQKDDGTNASN
jgi:hypothetical protein